MAEESQTQNRWKRCETGLDLVKDTWTLKRTASLAWLKSLEDEICFWNGLFSAMILVSGSAWSDCNWVFFMVTSYFPTIVASTWRRFLLIKLEITTCLFNRCPLVWWIPWKRSSAYCRNLPCGIEAYHQRGNKSCPWIFALQNISQPNIQYTWFIGNHLNRTLLVV